MSKKKIAIISISALVLAGAIYFGVTKFAKKPEAPKYNVQKIRMMNNSSNLDANGTVEANEVKGVFVDKRLKVKELFVKEGDYVEKGTVLMTFDESDKNTIMRNIEKEKLNQSKISRDLGVARELAKVGGSSKNDVLNLQDQLAASKLTLATYQEDLAKTVPSIKSPVSGTITKLTAQENYLVNTDQPLLQITDLSDIKIVLEIPEYDIQKIALGQKLKLKPEAFEKKQAFDATVTKISKLSTVSPTTKENIVKIEVTPDAEIPTIVPGFKVAATIEIAKADNTLSVPKTALLQEADGKFYVFTTNEKNEIIKTSVEAEMLEGTRSVIKSGLKAGDTIVVNPDATLKEKTVITPDEAVPEAKATRERGIQSGTRMGPPGGN